MCSDVVIAGTLCMMDGYAMYYVYAIIISISTKSYEYTSHEHGVDVIYICMMMCHYTMHVV